MTAAPWAQRNRIESGAASKYGLLTPVDHDRYEFTIGAASQLVEALRNPRVAHDCVAHSEARDTLRWNTSSDLGTDNLEEPSGLTANCW
jgi:hypothetical protein